MENNNVFGDCGIEVKLRKYDDFLKIAETLTRMGIGSNKTHKLYQSCHILHKRGNYAIMHFKEMFKLDGKEAEMTSEDVARRNSIALLLKEWGLVDLDDDILSYISDNKIPMSKLKIISHANKSNWELIPKYSIGK